ncbi:outer membrane protein assembly factor BamB family protein [Calycomorphotria hydatis]|uniref:Outer membrane biogenesis protein BamB n=1 Tax=Calycomorphotria hydatis TaxID=2528027 RepID=A0A517TCV9_9PLAN|nr:PQQ-binding-like beta-propeller repeat protein [Calycomorphotria hydatis]QDT66202.1 outer membrane biogenesis protein BamB [Calycomorphotria hydatis]
MRSFLGTTVLLATILCLGTVADAGLIRGRITVVSEGLGRFRMEDTQGQKHSVKYNTRTRVRLDGRATSIKNIRVGQEVSVYTTTSGVANKITIREDAPEGGGTVNGLGGLADDNEKKWSDDSEDSGVKNPFGGINFGNSSDDAPKNPFGNASGGTLFNTPSKEMEKPEDKPADSGPVNPFAPKSSSGSNNSPGFNPFLPKSQQQEPAKSEEATNPFMPKPAGTNPFQPKSEPESSESAPTNPFQPKANNNPFEPTTGNKNPFAPSSPSPKPDDVASVGKDAPANPFGTPGAKMTPPDSEPETPIQLASNRNAKDDWPQFGGPARDNRSTSTGLLTEWPEDGPELLWTATGFGQGYSSVSVVGDRIYTLGTSGNEEQLFAVDAATGNIGGTIPVGPLYNDGQGNGPRSTPTFYEGKVYALGANGDLICVNDETGETVWSKNILAEYGGENIQWGISESPLIHNNQVIVTPGGSAASVVALNPHTGRETWRSQIPQQPKAGYSSAIATNFNRSPQLVVFTSHGLVGLDARSGNPLWGENSASNDTANCSLPLAWQNSIFYASGYGTGGSLVNLNGSARNVSASVAYHTDDMANHHGGMVIVGNYLYGSSNPGVLRCINLQSGDTVWQNRSVGKGSIIYADGHLYLRSERDAIALIEATPEGYREKSRFIQPNRSDRPAWAHLVIAQGKMFVRDQDKLLCYDVRAK